MPTAELVAVQSFMSLADYASEEAYRAKIESLMRKVDAVRARGQDGRFLHPALAVFPENIGTFLGIAGSYDRVKDCATTDAAIGKVVLRRLPELLRTMARYGVASPKRAVLVMLSRTVWPIWFRAFRDAARAHDCWIVAGSAVVARNKHGLVDAPYEPESGRCYNLSLAFAPDGRAVNETRKVNLVPTLEDVLGITPGPVEALAPFDTALGRVGTMICYDGFREPHTRRELHFRAVGAHFDAKGVRILAQPAANPWPWEEKWFFAEPGETQLRKEQWLNEGLCTQLRDLPHVRYAVNPQLIGSLLGNRFDGRSYIFERTPSGDVKVLAESKDYRLAPESEEAVCARVEV